MNKEMNELDWLACQYVLGELSSDEAEQFELQLASDEDACVALSNAVQVLQYTSAALQPPTVQPAGVGRVPAAVWWATVAAVCVVCLTLFNSFLIAPNDVASKSANSDTQPSAAAELAIAWSQTPNLDPAEPVEPAEDPVLEVGELDGDVDPSWVMVAVSGIEMHQDELD